jgi:hypothetical protein
MKILPKILISFDWRYCVLGIAFGVDINRSTIGLDFGLGPLILSFYYAYNKRGN